MKKFFVILILTPFLVFAQESKFYLIKRDTLYIVLDPNMLQDFTNESFQNLWLSEKIDGVETVFTVFSDSLKEKREIYKKMEKEDFDKGLVGKRRLNQSKFYGLDFVKYTLNYKSIVLYKKTLHGWYKNFRKANKKNIRSLQDSIDYDNKLYLDHHFKNENAVFSSSVLSSDDLKKVNTFYLDSTNKKFNELVNVINKKTFVFFISVKKIGKYKKNGPDYFLFNEVFYRKKLNGDN